MSVRRDPLLVTAHGRDGVAIQCFPVPPDGGTMKIRIDLIVPTTRSADGRNRLDLPRIDIANHALCGKAKHEVRIGPSATGSFTTPELGAAASAFHLPASTPRVFVADDDGRRIIVQRDVERTTEPVRAFVVVVDVGMSTAGRRDGLSDVLGALPDGAEVAVCFAGDEVVHATDGFARLDAALRSSLAAAARAQQWAGGIDATPALLAARRLVDTRPGARTLWLRGAQEYAESDGWADLGRAWGGEPRITPVPLAAGRNVVAERVMRLEGHDGLPVGVEPLAAALQRVRGWCAPEAWSAPAWSVATTRPGATEVAADVLAPLWAAQRVRELLSEGRREEALRLGRRHRIITRITGAVVLETDAEYEAAGLNDLELDEFEGVSPIPEPGMLALLLLAGVMLFLRAWWRRHEKRRVAVATRLRVR